MDDQHPAYNTAAIRKLLMAAFDDPALDAFVLDNYPDVYDKFGRGLRRDEKITLLLDHCRRIEGELNRLAAAVQAPPPPPGLDPAVAPAAPAAALSLHNAGKGK